MPNEAPLKVISFHIYIAITTRIHERSHISPQANAPTVTSTNTTMLLASLKLFVRLKRKIELNGGTTDLLTGSKWLLKISAVVEDGEQQRAAKVVCCFCLCL